MRERNSDKDWDQLGQDDPYFAVLTDAKYKKDMLTEAVRREFFASGEKQIEETFTLMYQHLDKAFHPTSALDFGCGVGRLLLPLAARCKSVVGLDVSDAMLAEARRVSAERELHNTTFLKSDDNLSSLHGTFDLVYSLLVFQHIPVRRGYLLLEKLIHVLNDKGIGVIHLPYNRDVSLFHQWGYRLRVAVPPVHNFLNLKEGKAYNTPLMQHNIYKLNQVFSILHKNNCQDIYLRFNQNLNYREVTLYFQK
jgi:2-polyprenyl-3-methyl-5-hydroxy-6-metoxy-1,4-benzoquinol methylase